MQLADQVGDQGAPSRLVRGAETAAGVAIVIFVEQEVVLEVRIGLHLLVAAEDRSPSVAVAPEDVDQAAPQLVGDLFQRLLPAGPDRAFDAKLVAVELVELVQALDDQIVERHPDRTAPIGVAAEKIALRFGRDILYFAAKG